MITTQKVEGFYLVKNDNKIVTATSNKQFVERVLKLEELCKFVSEPHKSDYQQRQIEQLIEELR